MPSSIDSFVAYKFIKQLSMPWKQWKAYDKGLIDNKGSKIRKAKTPGEQKAYPTWKVLVRNIKRVLEKLPFGKTTMGSFAAALWMIKEELEIEDITVLEEEFTKYLNSSQILIEAEDDEEKINTVEKGRYQTEDGDIIFLRNNTESFATVLGQPLFLLTDGFTGTTHIVRSNDIGIF